MRIIGEYYHVYNRGAHKAPIFLDGTDYWRFLALLYLANNEEPVKFSNIKPDKVFRHPRTKILVDIVAYCLMPNHFHIAMKENAQDGMRHFLHRLCTAYSMYYNAKYDHSGTILQGSFKAKHIDSDDYFRYLIQYIHLNPFGIEEPDMLKSAKSEYLEEATAYSKTYQYSRFKDYLGEKRPQGAILAVTSEVEPR